MEEWRKWWTFQREFCEKTMTSSDNMKDFFVQFAFCDSQTNICYLVYMWAEDGLATPVLVGVGKP